MSEPLTPERARALVEQAGRLSAAARSSASSAPAAFLLGLGGLSSMFAVALFLIPPHEQRLIWLPLSTLLIWLAILLVFLLSHLRSTKRGFGRRWRQMMLAWGLLWAATVIGSTTFMHGRLWFAVASVLALTAVTAWGAWRESQQ